MPTASLSTVCVSQWATSNMFGEGPVQWVQSWHVQGEGGSLYGKYQCIKDNGHIPPPNGQTDTTKNITFPLLRWRVVTMLVSIRVD